MPCNDLPPGTDLDRERCAAGTGQAQRMSKSLPMCDGRSRARTEIGEILDAIRQGNRRGLERVTPRENSQSSLRRAAQYLLLGVSVVGATVVVAGLWTVGSVLLDIGY